MNVNDAAQVEAALAAIQKQFGEIAILVNNAGITRDNLLLRMKDEEWDDIMATEPQIGLSPVAGGAARHDEGALRPHHQHHLGDRRHRQRRADQLRRREGGRRSVSRKSLAREVGSRNITVNCVAPGFIDTDMTRALAEEQRDGARSRQIPLGRLGRVGRRRARRSLFLASPGRRLHHRMHAARQRRHAHGLSVCTLFFKRFLSCWIVVESRSLQTTIPQRQGWPRTH